MSLRLPAAVLLLATAALGCGGADAESGDAAEDTLGDLSPELQALCRGTAVDAEDALQPTWTTCIDATAGVATASGRRVAVTFAPNDLRLFDAAGVVTGGTLAGDPALATTDIYEDSIQFIGGDGDVLVPRRYHIGDPEGAAYVTELERFTDTGDRVWGASFRAFDYIDAFATADGGAVAVGFDFHNRSTLLRFDAAGREVLRMPVADGQASHSAGAAVGPGDDVWSATGGADPTLSRLDATGAAVWRTVIPGSSGLAGLSAQGAALLSAYGSGATALGLTVVDASGSVTATSELAIGEMVLYPTFAADGTVSFAAMVESGTFSGHTIQNASPELTLFKLDRDLSVRAVASMHDVTSFVYAAALLALPGGGFAAVVPMKGGDTTFGFDSGDYALVWLDADLAPTHVVPLLVPGFFNPSLLPDGQGGVILLVDLPHIGGRTLVARFAAP